jgi:hypothetical protein
MKSSTAKPIMTGLAFVACYAAGVVSHAYLVPAKSPLISGGAPLTSLRSTLHAVDDRPGSRLSGNSPAEARADEVADPMAQILAQGNPVKAHQLVSSVLERLQKGNPVELEDFLLSAGGALEHLHLAKLMAFQWGSVDGPAALAATLKMTGDARATALSAALAGWTSRDPEAAMRWLETAPRRTTDEGRVMEAGFVSGLMQGNPSAAQDYVLKQADPAERERLLRVFVAEKFKQGTKAAQLFTDSLTDPDLQQSAFSSLVEAFYEASPGQAVSFASQHANNPNSGPAIGELAGRLTATDPAEGLALVHSLPVGPARLAAHEQAFREWAVNDPTEASAALDRMPRGPDRDAAAAGLAQGVTHENLPAAMAWAEAISDRSLKQQTLTSILRNLYHSDPRAVHHYLKQRQWSDSQSISVLAP